MYIYIIVRIFAGGRRSKSGRDAKSVSNVRYDEERFHRHVENFNDIEHDGPIVRRFRFERLDLGERSGRDR